VAELYAMLAMPTRDRIESLTAATVSIALVYRTLFLSISIMLHYL
jgi:hypothetical protein